MILENNLLVKVREILQCNDTILFIGSGLSMWSGLPSWGNLLEEMAKYIEGLGYSAELVRKEIDSGNLLQAASYGVDLLPPREFPHFILEGCLYGKALPHLIHEKVVKLGPTCFITTNYDHLIEDAFRQIHGYALRSVTNNQLAETADIIQARANNFIFKPHGDVTDSNSIILTREQYRSILHGERKAALEALKILLVSRPVIFLGFGLRDPDFIFIQDYLMEVYKGQACEYYAIMADVSDQERSFWLRNYGLHIISYQREGKNKRDHSPLLTLLDDLLNTTEKLTSASSIHKDIETVSLLPEHILALARYSKKITYTMTITSELEFPLNVSYVENGTKQQGTWKSHYFTHSQKIESLLSDLKSNIILIGNPGAGKTYALKRYCSTLAKILEDSCLNDSTFTSTFLVPLYMDMKLYNGNLWKIAEEMLPPLLRLDELCKQRQVIFMLDAYNELPREYIENGHIEKDLAFFIQKIGGNRIIIASRTTDGLQNLPLPLFSLDEIDRDFVSKYLQEHNESFKGVFEEELLDLLSKPLYFRLYVENKIALRANFHPRQVYESLFAILVSDFDQRFGQTVDLKSILSPIAYDSINTGQETMDLVELEEKLLKRLSKVQNSSCNVKEFINWLISREVLIPAPQSRLSFFHQSITEYLAARELARLYRMAPEILDNCLRYTRWDQALYLTLGFLNKKHTRSFMKRLMQTDQSLAVKATKFVEYGRDQVVTEILNAVPTGLTSGWNLYKLPVSTSHEARLREILKHRNTMGGVAAGLLLNINGVAIKNELIEEMFLNPSDFNFCTELGRALRPFADSNDLVQIINRFRDLTFHDKVAYSEEEEIGLLDGCAEMFEEFNTDNLLKAFQPLQKLDLAQLSLLHRFLWTNNSQKVNNLKIELIKYGDKKAVFPLNLALISRKKAVDPNVFDKEVVLMLIESLSSEEQGFWAIDILRYISEIRKDLSDILKESAARAKGLLKLILLYCYTPVDEKSFWDEINQLPLEGVTENDRKFLPFFGEFKIDWTGKSDILIKLLKQKDKVLAHAALRTFDSVKVDQHWQIVLDPLEWWIDLLSDEESYNVFGDNMDFRSSLGKFIANHATLETHRQIVSVFNLGEPRIKELLAKYVLNGIPGLTSDQLTGNSIKFLIEDLKNNRIHGDHSQQSILAFICTEEFVEKTLLPLLEYEEEPLKTNLHDVLLGAGRRHHRRYVFDP